MSFFGQNIFSPITPDNLVINIEMLVKRGQGVIEQLVWSDGPAGGGKPPKGLYGLPSDIYSFGLACLALRAHAVSLSGTSFSSTYSKLCRQYGFEKFSAKSRRHSMYFPILSDDDGFNEIISEESQRLTWLFDQPLVGTEYVAERVKNLRLSSAAIDWLPFGGSPPKNS